MAETNTNKATTTTKVAKNDKKLRVTLVKSAIGYSKDQKRTVVALGLNKLNSQNELPDNSAVRGMIFKIKHLVRVEEIEEGYYEITSNCSCT